MSKEKHNSQVALIYHINLNHLSLSGLDRNAYVDQYLAEMVQHIKVRAAISIPAEDLIYLQLNSPETYRDLVSNPNVTFLLSTYAHVIAGIDFDMYLEHVNLGAELLRAHIPTDKIVDVGYPSEVEAPPASLVEDVHKLWKTILLGDTRIFPKLDADHICWQSPSGVHFPTIVSRRETQYRPEFHRFFREEAPANDVVSALRDDAKKWSTSIGHVSRIDMEAPLFNEVKYPDGRSTGPRIDLWVKLQNHYAKFPELFTSISEIILNAGRSRLPSRHLSHDPIEDQKWQFHDHVATVGRSGDAVVRGTQAWYQWMSMHHSDYFCTKKDDLLFKASGDGQIRIVKGQAYREPELMAKFALLEGNNYAGDDKMLGDYLENMRQVYAYLTERDDEK